MDVLLSHVAENYGILEPKEKSFLHRDIPEFDLKHEYTIFLKEHLPSKPACGISFKR